MKSGRLDSFLSLFRGMKSPPIERSDSSFETVTENSLHFPSLSSVIGMMGLIGSPPATPSLEGVSPIMQPQDSVSPVSSPSLLPNLPGNMEITSNHANFTRTFLKSILTSIDSKDPFVANAWLETLLDVIDLLPKEVVREEILPLAVKKGQSPEITSRLASCKLIGKISTKFDPQILKTEILGVVQILSQDVSGEVRGNMCLHLSAVAKGVGLDSTKSILLPELVDLCSDEEIGVRLTGINTVCQLIPLLDQETRINTLIPLVRKICERALRVEDATLSITAHLLGRICHGLHDDLSEEQKVWFINFYCTISKLGLPDAKKPEVPMPDLVAEVRSGECEAECRHQCAYNLPGMIVFAGGPAAYRKYLHDTLTSFVTDPSLTVRITVALSFHQVCTLIGSEVGLVRDLFLKLLRSENMEILSAVIPNTSHILAAFHHHRVITQSSVQNDVIELIGALEQGEETISISSNWRVHSEILRQMAALALCLPPDILFSEVVPLMIVRMHTVRPIPCRHSAARTLLVYLRHMDSSEHCDHICSTLLSEFCKGTSCHKRMLFLNICRLSFELLPRSYFKTYFFRPLLSLHTDKVPNIRLKLVTLLPLVKSILVLPDDKQRLQELETVVGRLLKEESDKDVTAAISSVITQLDKIEVCESERGSPEGAAAFDSFPEDKISASQQAPKNKHILVKNGDENLEAKAKGSERLNKKINLNQSSSKQVPSLSSRRSNVPGRIPAYVAAERRRSRTFAPEIPPDEKTVMRISTLDPSTDEFLVDAGIRIDEAAIQGHSPNPHSDGGACSTQGCFPHPVSPTPRPPPIYTTASVRQQPFQFQSRLRPPSTSRIPVKGKPSDVLPSSVASKERLSSSEVKPRSRVQPRTSRPVSGVHSTPSNPSPIMSSRGKSLSHENLRSTRLVLTSGSKTSTTTRSDTHDPSSISGQISHRTTGGSRIRQPQGRGSLPTSCNSSPGGSRCTSPILEEGRANKGGSASSSPNTSRCTSPSIEENRSARGIAAGSSQKRNTQGGNISKTRQLVPSANSTGKGRASKLPLPKAKK